MKKIILIAWLVFLAWCTQNNISQNSSKSSSISNTYSSFSSNVFTDISSKKNESISSSYAIAERSVIFLWKQTTSNWLAKWKENTFTISPSSEQKVTMKTFLSSWEKINLKISPSNSSKVVLRLTNIISDEKMDWPFSNDYTYEVKKTWNYEFVFWVNMMASNEKYSWDYKISIFIK